jgi:hypothetical protein
MESWNNSMLYSCLTMSLKRDLQDHYPDIHIKTFTLPELLPPNTICWVGWNIHIEQTEARFSSINVCKHSPLSLYKTIWNKKEKQWTHCRDMWPDSFQLHAFHNYSHKSNFTHKPNFSITIYCLMVINACQTVNTVVTVMAMLRYCPSDWRYWQKL